MIHTHTPGHLSGGCPKEDFLVFSSDYFPTWVEGVLKKMKIQSKSTEHHCKEYFQLNCAGYCERENKYFQIQKKTTFKFEQASKTNLLKDLLIFWFSQRHNMVIGHCNLPFWPMVMEEMKSRFNGFSYCFKLFFSNKYMSVFCKNKR